MFPGDWYSWEHGSFASFSQRFDPAILHQSAVSSGVEQWFYTPKVGSSKLSPRTKFYCGKGPVTSEVS